MLFINFLFLSCLLFACAEPYTTYKKPELPAGACPTPFWIPDYVAAEFRKYPDGHPMREFFRAYVNQQRQLEKYYQPNVPQQFTPQQPQQIQPPQQFQQPPQQYTPAPY